MPLPACEPAVLPLLALPITRTFRRRRLSERKSQPTTRFGGASIDEVSQPLNRGRLRPHLRQGKPMPAHDHLARKWDYDSASKEERIASLLAMIKPEDYQHMAKVLDDMFGLEYKMVDSHPSNIKAIIKYKTFTFRKGISDASKTFMVLHSLGHYYFISRAKKVGVK